MSDLMRRPTGFLAPEDTFKSRTGGTLVKAGAVGGGLWLLAGALPFVTFPMLLIAMVVLGIFMY